MEWMLKLPREAFYGVTINQQWKIWWEETIVNPPFFWLQVLNWTFRELGGNESARMGRLLCWLSHKLQPKRRQVVKYSQATVRYAYPFIVPKIIIVVFLCVTISIYIVLRRRLFMRPRRLVICQDSKPTKTIFRPFLTRKLVRVSENINFSQSCHIQR